MTDQGPKGPPFELFMEILGISKRLFFTIDVALPRHLGYVFWVFCPMPRFSMISDRTILPGLLVLLSAGCAGWRDMSV